MLQQETVPVKVIFGGDHAEEVTDDSEGNVVQITFVLGIIIIVFGR